MIVHRKRKWLMIYLYPIRREYDVNEIGQRKMGVGGSFLYFSLRAQKTLKELFSSCFFLLFSIFLGGRGLDR